MSFSQTQHFQRSYAIRMARAGMPEHIIALRLGLDLAELRHLHATAMRVAALEANFLIWDALFQMAKSGKNTAATIFWLRTRAGAVPQKPSPLQPSNDFLPPNALLVTGPNGERMPTSPELTTHNSEPRTENSS